MLSVFDTKTPMKKYSVLMVDDHQILLEGTRAMINHSSGDFHVKDVAMSAEEASTLLKAHDYDVLITDYKMPGMSGMELIQLARAVSPDIKVIVLSMHDEPAVIKELLGMGVEGFVLKSDTHESIYDALNKVVQGSQYLSQGISHFLIYHSDTDSSTHTLSPREVEITKLIAREFNTRQIAEILHISERTVETHRKNILKKTKVSGLVGLIKYAYQHDLI